MPVLDRILTNLSDIKEFGPQFLLRHSPRLTGSHTAIVGLRDGQKIHLRAGESDVAAVRQTFLECQYAIGFNSKVTRRVEQRYRDLLASGQTPIIVDAGANIGAASLWFSRTYPKAKIVAVEPEPGNFAVLAKNAKLADNIEPTHAAIGSQPGFVSVINEQLGWAARTERTDAGIPIITMLEAFAGGAPFIAKIDIEGFEADLFSANTEWLAQTTVVFIEPHDWLMPEGNTSKSFQAAMGKQDYEIYLAGEILTYVRR